MNTTQKIVLTAGIVVILTRLADASIIIWNWAFFSEKIFIPAFLTALLFWAFREKFEWCYVCDGALIHYDIDSLCKEFDLKPAALKKELYPFGGKYVVPKETLERLKREKEIKRIAQLKELKELTEWEEMENTLEEKK